MGEGPSEIRAQIEQTRERVGEEVDALSYKTDVGARVSDYVDDKKAAVRAKFTGVRDVMTDSMPDPRVLKRGASHVRQTAASNPLGLALGGVAVGFVVGTVLHQTRVENEQLGALSDRLVDAAKDTASEAVDRGKQVAREAAGSAIDAARESGRDQLHELSGSIEDRTHGLSTAGS